MRVLFIYPTTSGTGEIPINISYLQSVLKQSGHEVRIFDVSDYRMFSLKPSETQVNSGLFKPVKNKMSAIGQNLKDFSPWEDLIRIVSDYKPGLIATTSFTTNFKLGVSFLNEVKKYSKDIPTIFGGIHTTLNPGEAISEPSIDMICIGEGEETLAELCDSLESNRDITFIRNLWIKKEGKIIKNSCRPFMNLDKLPFQVFDGFNDRNFYRPLAGRFYRMANVAISRGCIFQCSYCVNHAFQKMFKNLGNYHRKISVEKAIQNLMYIKKKHNIEMLRFWDEDFTTVSLDYLKNFADEYKKEINLPFLIYSRVNTMNENKLKILKDMRCVTIAMGIESGNEYIRNNILKRHMSNEEIVKAFHMVKRYGVRVSAYNMIGLPFETRKNIYETIDLNRRCKPDTSSVSFLEPYPNTEIYSTCVNNNFVDSGYVPTHNFFAPHIKEILISHKELTGLIKTFTLYTRVPRLLFPLLKFCERNNWLSAFLFKVIVKFYSGQ